MINLNLKHPKIVKNYFDKFFDLYYNEKIFIFIFLLKIMSHVNFVFKLSRVFINSTRGLSWKFY